MSYLIRLERSKLVSLQASLFSRDLDGFFQDASHSAESNVSLLI